MKQENGRYAAGFLFAVATFVVMAIWLCTQYTPQRLWELFCSVRLRWLAGAAGLMVVYWVLESTELHLALKRFSPQQAPCDTFRATMIGQFFNCITPFASGGQPMQALYLMKKGVALSFASCSLLIKFIVYQFVLTLYSAVTLALCFRQFAGRVPLVGWLAAAGFGINLLVIVGLLCLGFLRRPTERFLYGILSLLQRIHLIKEQTAQQAAERMQKELEEFYQGFAQIRSDWWGILQMSLLTAVQLTAFFLVPLCIFYAFGMGRADVLLMVCAGAFVLNFTSFIPLPGAAAGAEIGFHTVFGLFFPASVLSLAILLWRLFTFYLPILVGGVFTMTAGVWGRGKRKFQLDSPVGSRYNQRAANNGFADRRYHHVMMKSKESSNMEFLSRVLKGLVVGVANIIPGVSGGTMAVVMGIYDRLIGAVSDLRRDFKNSLLYLFPIGIGAVLGIVLFSHLIKFLLEGYPMPTNLFFLGLILGSIPMIFRRARKESFQKISLLPFAVSFAVMLLMTIFQNVSDASSALITTLTPLTAIRLLLSAAVAAACMIMPGISGSMVMVLLGVYTSVLTAISDLNIPLLLPVGVGVLLGIFFGAKGINWCMKRYEQQTYFAILGLIAGSVPPILLNAGFTPGVQTIVSLFTLAAGAAIAWWMGKLES